MAHNPPSAGEMGQNANRQNACMELGTRRSRARDLGTLLTVHCFHTDVEGLVTLIRASGLRSATPVGVSGSGVVALDLAQVHPEFVEAFVFISSGLSGFKRPGCSSERWSRSGRPSHLVIAIVPGQPRCVFRWGLMARSLDQIRPIGICGGLLPRCISPLFRASKTSGGADFRVWMRCPFPDPPTGERLAAITAPPPIIAGDQDEPDILPIALGHHGGANEGTPRDGPHARVGASGVCSRRNDAHVGAPLD